MEQGDTRRSSGWEERWVRLAPHPEPGCGTDVNVSLNHNWHNWKFSFTLPRGTYQAQLQVSGKQETMANTERNVLLQCCN